MTHDKYRVGAIHVAPARFCRLNDLYLFSGEPSAASNTNPISAIVSQS
jgi:hypothetical protein